MIQAHRGGRAGRTERQPNRPTRGRSKKVPSVVPDIPVIHRLLTEFFTSATRTRGAWCSGDRDGSPRLPGRPATARRMRQATEGPISAGRQLGRTFGFFPGPAGKRRRKSQSSLARRGSWGSSGLR
jgi:hypothetical protein